MKTKKFDNLMKELYTEEEIKVAKLKAKIRAKMMIAIADNVKKTMEKENIGFNELVKLMGTSPAQLNRVLNGNANLTIDSLIKVCTALHIEPYLTFKKVS